jgi:hypothetical protein
MPALKAQTIRSVTPGGDGVVSEIADHRPNEFISLRHLGCIVSGAEDTSSEAVRSWTATAQGATLTVDQDIIAVFAIHPQRGGRLRDAERERSRLHPTARARPGRRERALYSGALDLRERCEALATYSATRRALQLRGGDRDARAPFSWSLRSTPGEGQTGDTSVSPGQVPTPLG